ncbi:hypothetical protein WJX73_005035 [Symbiochloris irregularis]|uniref:RRM domain-containing protein n=1 Tax=Symbiochloris irregularis TaxID=706552 RepID=A0AAW1NNJ4_9CHLO
MEPSPPGDDEEHLTAPGEETEPEPPGSEQAPGTDASGEGQQAGLQQAVSGAEGYGYAYPGYGAGYTDPSYDYSAYYNAYYYPQGQSYDAQPPAAAGYYAGYEAYQQSYEQLPGPPATSEAPAAQAEAAVEAPALSTPLATPVPSSPSKAPDPPSEQPAPSTGQESFVMGVMAAAAMAAKPKDNGPTPEALAEIQRKLQEAHEQSERAAAEKEAEAKELAKKKGMPTLKGAKLAFVKPGLVAPQASAKGASGTPTGASAAAASHPPPVPRSVEPEPRTEAHRALIMQRLAAMEAIRSGKPAPAPDLRKRSPSPVRRPRSPSSQSAGSASPAGRWRREVAHQNASPSRSPSPAPARRIHSQRSGRRDSGVVQGIDRRHSHAHGNDVRSSEARPPSRRQGRRSQADYDSQEAEDVEEGRRERRHRSSKAKKPSKDKHSRKHRRHRQSDQEPEAVPAQGRRHARGARAPTDYEQYYDDQDQLAAAAAAEPDEQPPAVRPVPASAPVAPVQAVAAAPASVPAPATVASRTPGIKSPPRLAELRARAQGLAPPTTRAGSLPAQVKEAAAAALARRHVEVPAVQRTAPAPAPDSAAEALAPQTDVRPSSRGGRPRSASHRRPRDEYQEPADQGVAEDEVVSSEEGRRHRREHKKQRRDGRHRDGDRDRDRSRKQRKRRRPSVSLSPSPSPPAANGRPHSRTNGWTGDKGDNDRRPGYFQHDDRQALPHSPRQRHSRGRRRGRSYSSGRSRSPAAHSRSRSHSRSPDAKAAAQAEADARAQKLAADVARAAAAAKLAADANNNLAATRPARKIYVGSLPVAASEAEITHFFNQVMAAAQATTPHMPGQPVVSCYINHDKRFAFVELRTVEEASNALALDGVGYRGETLRIRRPSDYNSMTMAHLGPTQPSATATAGLMSLGGLAAKPSLPGPPSTTEPQAAAAIPPPPPVPAKAEAEPGELREAAPAPPASASSVAVPANAPAAAAAAPAPGPPPAPAAPAGPSLVIRLANMVQRSELTDDEEYEDIRDDIYWEIQDKYGAITGIQVPRPGPTPEQDPAGVGLVFVAFQKPDSAAAALAGLHRRLFGENRVDAQAYDQKLFDAGFYQ